MAFKFISHCYDKRNKHVFVTADYPTREEAVAAGFYGAPEAMRVVTGYGYNGTLDMRSVKRVDWEAERDKKQD